jgi:hypothetical protein
VLPAALLSDGGDVRRVGTAPAGRAVVVYRTSDQFPALSGDPVAAVLSALDSERVIEYRPVGSLHQSALLAAAESDIVVEDLRYPGYGLLGAAGMAGGSLVLANMTDAGCFSEEPPIQHVTPDTLERLLRDGSQLGQAFSGHAGDGPAYARRHHDGRASVDVVQEMLGLLDGHAAEVPVAESAQ